MSNIENTNTTKDRMGLVQALQILHSFHDYLKSAEIEQPVAEALEVIFEWINNIVILLNKNGGRKDGCE